MLDNAPSIHVDDTQLILFWAYLYPRLHQENRSSDGTSRNYHSLCADPEFHAIIEQGGFEPRGLFLMIEGDFIDLHFFF